MKDPCICAAQFVKNVRCGACRRARRRALSGVATLTHHLMRADACRFRLRWNCGGQVFGALPLSAPQAPSQGPGTQENVRTPGGSPLRGAVHFLAFRVPVKGPAPDVPASSRLPSEAHRSFVPISSRSTPPTAAMLSSCSSTSAVSIMMTTMVAALSAPMASSAETHEIGAAAICLPLAGDRAPPH